MKLTKDMKRRKEMWNEISVGYAEIREAIDAGIKERIIFAMEDSFGVASKQRG